MHREWDVSVRWAPYLLDPSIPPEGRERTPQTTADSPKSHLELMGEQRGIEFRRGRTFTPNSHLALEAGEFAGEHGDPARVLGFHRALFRAYFTDFEDIADAGVLARIAGEHGFDRDALQGALESGRYREAVDQGIAHAYEIGVSGVPTFIFNERFAVVGAQEYATFASVLERLGGRRRDAANGDRGSASPGAV